MRYFKFLLIFVFSVNSFAQKSNNNGLYYFKKAYKFDINQKKDSAFYYYSKAEKQFYIEDNLYNQARVILNIGNLQSEQNDLVGSEINTIKALLIFKKLNKPFKIFTCYNKLGILLKNKEQYHKANEYYNKALKVADSLNKTKLQLIATSNIAINYKQQKEYQKSIEMFYRVLKHDSIKNYPIKKARALNYIAYCNYKLKKKDSLLQLFFEAKEIYNTKNHIPGVISNNLFLAEYYISEDKLSEAKKYLNESLNIAKKNKRNSNILLILKLLSKVNPIKSGYYFNEYTNLNDSIDKVQLLHKNQFAIITYETIEKEQKIIIQKNTIKTKNKLQKLLIVIIILSILSAIMLLFYNKKLHIKNNQINSLQIEIRHRLKNNLAMVSSFINKAKKNTNNINEIENYKTLNGRINSMKSIQELLYKNSNIDSINLNQIITSIAKLSENGFKSNKQILIKTQIENININSKKAEITGLIINELITNAYKYAFINKKNGIISIKAFIKDKNILFLIEDDGIGFPEDLDNKKSSSFGIKLIKGLTNQLNGKITFSNKEKGTKISLTIPL